MVQRAFVIWIFRCCKQLGLHTCIDTSGRLGDRFTDEELMDIDLNLLDIKSGDPAIYEKVTRQPLQPTLDYARRLSALGRPMWIRFVLVPGLTDAYDNVERVADICAELKSVERVEIQRFHQMGRDKWHKLGFEYPLENVEPPDVALTERPIMALFLTIALGYLVGEINIKGFSLGGGRADCTCPADSHLGLVRLPHAVRRSGGYGRGCLWQPGNPLLREQARADGPAGHRLCHNLSRHDDRQDSLRGYCPRVHRTGISILRRPSRLCGAKAR
jgi:hypothetical protein